MSKPTKNLRLTPEAIRRLGIQAVMTGKTESQVVEELIERHLREYVVSHHRGRAEVPALATVATGPAMATA